MSYPKFVGTRLYEKASPLFFTGLRLFVFSKTPYPFPHRFCRSRSCLEDFKENHADDSPPKADAPLAQTIGFSQLIKPVNKRKTG